MKTLLFLLLTFLSFSSSAIIPLFHVETYAALNFGSYEQKEDSARYNHDALTYGAEIGARLGLDLFGLKFGGIYSVGRHHFDSDREDTQATQNQIQGYNNDWQTNLTGVYGGFSFPVLPLRIWGEYYLKARSKAVYAGPDGENPYRKEEATEGKGVALGIALEEEIIYLGLLFRRLNYKKFGVESGNISAGDELGEKEVSMLSIQAGVFF
jgi:hypothetical protein